MCASRAVCFAQHTSSVQRRNSRCYLGCNENAIQTRSGKVQRSCGVGRDFVAVYVEKVAPVRGQRREPAGPGASLAPADRRQNLIGTTSNDNKIRVRQRESG